jgi:hypothetical protein
MVLPALLLSCGRGQAPARPRDQSHAQNESADASSLLYSEVASKVGLDFVHHAGGAEEYFMPAVMGGGACVFDADGDDDLDLLLVDSGGSGTPPSPLAPRLYLQADGATFAAAAAAGFDRPRGYGMGCAVGDVDNDGDLDLFVSAWGEDALYRNRGDGTFEDTTADSGLGDTAWSTSATFLDFDRDGWLDLYVARYVDLDPSRICAREGGRRDFCGPIVFEGVDDLLYRNEKGGRFVDVSLRAGITGVEDAGLGVVAADFDDDGWIDLYVANDADPNNLWRNGGDGTFIDEAILLGVAFNRYGAGEAGMGVTAGDADGDGDLDLFVTHLIEETNTFYRCLGGGAFEDATAHLDLGLPSMDFTGFGTAFFDGDGDGDLDLAVANGAVKRRPRPLVERQGWWWNDYAEPNLLLENRSGRFVEAGAGAGPDWGRLEVSRGLVPFDYDRDGDQDLLVTNLDGPARLYRNELMERASPRPHWVEIRALDPRYGREAIGARVVLETERARRVRHATPPGGYLTGGHAFVHVGLGDEERILGFEVRWPDGLVESFAGGEADRTWVLERGRGTATEGER